MEKYWKVFLVTKDNNFCISNKYIIERESDYLLFDVDQKSISIIRKEVLPNFYLVVETTKEKALEALKNTFNLLQLPKEINFIKHKF